MRAMTGLPSEGPEIFLKRLISRYMASEAVTPPPGELMRRIMARIEGSLAALSSFSRRRAMGCSPGWRKEPGWFALMMMPEISMIATWLERAPGSDCTMRDSSVLSPGETPTTKVMGEQAGSSRIKTKSDEKTSDLNMARLLMQEIYTMLRKSSRKRKNGYTIRTYWEHSSVVRAVDS